MRPSHVLVLVGLLPLGFLVPLRAAASARDERADSLYAQAEQLLRRNTIETRRMAIASLEEATLLRPDDAQAQLTLARAYYQVGFLRSARQRYERVTRMDPGDAPARFGLGQVWRRDWLKYLDPQSLSRAIENYSEAARLDPRSAEAWLMLTPLLVEQNDLAAASKAAARAREAAPERPECELAVAYTDYRLGRIDEAGAAFRHAIPRLPRAARACFDDIAPVATEQDTFTLHRLPPREQAAFVERFWSEHDPDPTTPENEARLEYWSRVTQAFFLFFDARRREWDERGEVYVRYGPPKSAIYNPVEGSLAIHDRPTDRLGIDNDTVNPGGGLFPMNVLVWDYPELGMQVAMQDRLLSEHYLLPISLNRDTDPKPDPDSLAALDALASAGGRGVFPTLPPGVKPMAVDGHVARFEGPGGPRVLAQIEAAGEPADSLTADWAVFDSAGVEVARARHTLSPSPCDPAARRVAEFTASLEPGRYRLGLSVHDGHGHRGVHRDWLDVATPPRGLALSDVVVTCGAPELQTDPVVRISPNPGGHVPAGAPLIAYFEAYRLTPGRDGQSRFEYVYTVRATGRDSRIWIARALAPRPSTPVIQASRDEAFVGDVRRQFVRVPLRGLPPGTYRLDIQVTDLVSGEDARGSVPFVLDEPTALGH